MNYNTSVHRLIYCILTLFFGSMVLFLPETKTFPLPRSIMQVRIREYYSFVFCSRNYLEK